MNSVGACCLLSLVLAPPIPAPAPTLEELRRHLAATDTTKRESEPGIADRFEGAIAARSADSDEARALFGKWLFTRGRLREALPFLEEACLRTVNEQTCAAAASSHVAAGNWGDGASIARSYLDRACVASERLQVVILLQTKPESARTAAEGLVRLESDHEMGYLLLAAAHHRLGDGQRSQTALETGRRMVRKVYALGRIYWPE